MSKLIPLLAGIIVSVIFTIPTAQAANNAANLHCNAPFVKVRTLPNAIRCKRVGTFQVGQHQQAVNAYKYWPGTAGCNAHRGAVKRKLWQLRNKSWKVRVSFICAIIY